jgi:hypothetical protein
LLSGRAIIESVNPFADRPHTLRRPRRTARTAAAIIATACLTLLAEACGGSPVSQAAQLGSATSAGATHLNAALAFSRCMRSHGVRNFPDPDTEGNVPSSTQQALGVPKQTTLAAGEACKRLLPSGRGGAGTRGDQQKLAFALKVAQCMRRLGFPTYPDPTGPTASSQGSGTRFDGTSIDIKSPRFQATETACEKQAKKALGLP